MSSKLDRQSERLRRRIRGYDEAVAGGRVPWPGGFRRPGSMNAKKSAPKGRRP